MNESITEGAVPADHPMMIAWEKYKTSPEYANSFKWAQHKQHRTGSMWAAFVEGYKAAQAAE